MSDSSLTLAGSIGSGIVNGISRIILGALVDKVGFKKLAIFITLVLLLLSLTVYWAAYVPILYYICISLNYMCLGGAFSIWPVATTNVFGLKAGAEIYVWILFSPIISSVMNTIMCLYL